MVEENKNIDDMEVDFTAKGKEKKVVAEVPVAEEKPKKESVKEKKEGISEDIAEDDDTRTEEEKKLNLPFPEAAVVRLMKRHLDKEKMIRKEVKIAMNKWLGTLCEQVSSQINKFPYVMVNLHEFNEGKRVFDDLENFHKEKERILAHFDAIKKDIERLERDLGKVEKDLIGE